MAQMVAFMPHLLTSMVKSTWGAYYITMASLKVELNCSEEGILDPV
jgi:hypothetical protein